jgi:tetratricopeptide (TPR) repeat protein
MTSSNDFEPIKPAEVPLTQAEKSTAPSPLPWQQRPSTYVALAVCILLALLVIFVLPLLIKPVDTPAVIIQPESMSDQSPATVQETPFKDAQLAKARRESQDVLSQLLEKQSYLEKRNIQQWDEPAFQAALKKAAEGDRLYRQRQFDESQVAYRDALEQLSALEARIPQEISNTLTKGDEAFANGNADMAKALYQRVLAIDPANTQAESGIARTATLNEVLTLVTQANDALHEQQLEQAQDLFVQALTLDARHPEAIQGKEQVASLILERDFNGAMSRGFQALEKNQFSVAARAFRQALTLRPGDKAANSGLSQANNAAAQVTTKTRLNKAAALEASEQWHQARDIYQQILAGDSSVVEARLGQIRSSTRASLSDDIDKILRAPLRLASPNVLEHARQLLQDAGGIQSPGPNHRQQVDRLGEVLIQAVTPVPVKLRSDNTTVVTLFKVGELGIFSEKQLSLKPGNYVVAGSRSGYRDVRVEFQVTPWGMSAPIEVICREPIS